MARMLPIFVDEVPEYEARGEFMFVRWRGLEIALPISVCQRSMLACEGALAKWHLAHSGNAVTRMERTE